MKKADIPDVMIHDIIGDVSVNITVNHGASPIPVAVVIALVALMAIIVLAVAHF